MAGGVVYRRCQYVYIEEYSPHRYALDFGFDQQVPDFMLIHKEVPMLQFPFYVEYNLKYAAWFLQQKL